MLHLPCRHDRRQVPAHSMEQRSPPGALQRGVSVFPRGTVLRLQALSLIVAAVQQPLGHLFDCQPLPSCQSRQRQVPRLPSPCFARCCVAIPSGRCVSQGAGQHAFRRCAVADQPSCQGVLGLAAAQQRLVGEYMGDPCHLSEAVYLRILARPPIRCCPSARVPFLILTVLFEGIVDSLSELCHVHVVGRTEHFDKLLHQRGFLNVLVVSLVASDQVLGVGHLLHLHDVPGFDRVGSHPQQVLQPPQLSFVVPEVRAAALPWLDPCEIPPLC
mmetsp:Transcript_37236/g.105050  ORF Transcript_37236/g.105050 Transcript_37236/m.105050 type:complete len:272 (-) Transcript_37236:2707-3522(-)